MLSVVDFAPVRAARRLALVLLSACSRGGKSDSVETTESDSTTEDSAPPTESDPTDTEAAETDPPGDSDTDEIADTEVPPEPIHVELLPGSHNHAPDGTWWGSNMTKIARFGDRVFTTVIANDDDATTLSEFQIWVKSDEDDWVKATSFPTSRPGNLVVDSTGALHVLVFEPFDLLANDSIGRLVHYTLPNAGAGDLATMESEVVVDNDGSQETVNIRVGAAIGPDDTLAFAFGHIDWANPEVAHSEEVYVRAPGDSSWNRHLAGVQLEHEYYYPFVTMSAQGIGVLSVQDDWAGAGQPNVYQKIAFFGFDSAEWTTDLLEDLSGHTLAAERARLLEQSDLFEDSTGTMHAITKDFLGDTSYTVTQFHHFTRPPDGTWAEVLYDFTAQDLNWLKLVEVDGELFFLAVSWNRVYAMRVGEEPFELAVPGMITGAYPYVAGSRSGTAPSTWVELLLLNGDSGNYPDAENLYVRIPTSVLQTL
jgi:hypothetical protein